MSRDTLHGLVEIVDEKEIDTVCRILLKFVEEDRATQDEAEAIREARQEIEKGELFSHGEVLSFITSPKCISGCNCTTKGMECERIDDLNRNLVNAFIKQHWYTTTMIICGKEIDMTKTEGFYFSDGNNIVGLITYIVCGNIMEILSLDSLQENQGIGSKLVQNVIHEAKERKLQKIVLITTNDNINAIRFYQKRGFDMVHLFHNAMDVSRKLKPEIPLIGENSIPLRHEIEFELSI